MELRKIIVFDGYCNLCSGLVKFLTKADRKKQFKFAASQTDGGKRLIKEHNLEDVGLSIYYIEESKVYDRSQAVFQISSELGFPYSFILIFGVLGRPINDALYSIISRNRFRFFGKSTSCYMPTEEVKAKFIV